VFAAHPRDGAARLRDQVPVACERDHEPDGEHRKERSRDGEQRVAHPMGLAPGGRDRRGQILVGQEDVGEEPLDEHSQV
jgi:hypothetical protein